VFVDISPATRQLVERLGRPSDQQPALADCFLDPAEFGRVFSRVLEEGEIRDYRLALESGGPPAVLLSAVLQRDEHGDPAYVDGYLVDVSGLQAEGAGSGQALERMESSPSFLHQSVMSLSREALVVALETPVAEVARRMTEQDVTAALVSSAHEDVVGIVTDVDVRARAVAEEQPPGQAVQAIMSAPLVRVDGDAPAYVALLRMEDSDVHHLIVDADDGGPPRMVDRAELSRWARHAPMALLRSIADARSAREVARGVGRSAAMAEALMDGGTRVEHVTRLLTSVYDAATVRLFEMAIDESGPPPGAFAYVAMGSQGRGEVTLRSDQDSGIVYDADAGSALAAEYFASLGRRVRDGLIAAGYPACPGGVMASEPAWRGSTTEWAEVLDGWLRQPSPTQVTDLSVFLDLRLIHGSRELARSLRQQVAARLPQEQALLNQLARGALVFKPPMRLPGNIYLGGGAERGEIDLKDALQSLVAFARLFAVRHGLAATHTLERIVELGDRQLIPSTTRDELRESYRFLMDMRLRSQIVDVRAGRPPGSRVDLASLNHIEQESMRQAFGRIAAAQKQVDSEFPDLG
jgi:CBS domain-containing protein